MNLVDSVVDKTKALQENNGYPDQKMADLIGCSRTTYNLIKNGKKRAGGVFYRGALALLEDNGKGAPAIKRAGNNNDKQGRRSHIPRQTKETDIDLELNIDGNGKNEINTGIQMFDHLLSQLAQHGRFEIKLSASGDNQHHIIEDVAICLGKAFGKALGDKGGITRMGNATVPMDDALAMVVVDISGRGYTDLDLRFSRNSQKWQLLGFPPDLIRHFLETFANEARINLHAKVLNGTDDHHKAEALFKALGRALDIATRIDEKLAGELPTTKGLLEE